MSNAYDSTRGNTKDRERRKTWLLTTYAADTKVRIRFGVVVPCEPDHPEAVPACRCYRCGTLVTREQLVADRIVPGRLGGTYARTNIRPSCKPCSDKSGNEVKQSARNAGNQVPVV